MIKFSTSPLWFGTDDSFAEFTKMVAYLQDLEMKGPEAVTAAIVARGGDKESPLQLPPLWEKVGSTAVLKIHGSLVSGHTGFWRLFGILGYEDIQQAVAEISGDKAVTETVLSVASGGGQVNGVQSTAALIEGLAQRMAVATHTEELMASAAYWLGAAATEGHMYASELAVVGSVGTMRVLTDYSKADEKEGVTRKVVRFGKFKALANGIEPITDAAVAQAQELVDAAGNVFVNYVAPRRGVTAEAFQATMGEGRVFAAGRGAEIGIIDGIKSLAEVIQLTKALDKPKTPAHNPANRKDTYMKASLSKKSILAILAGTALDQLNLHAVEANAQGVAISAEDLVALQAEAAELQAEIGKKVTSAVEAAVTPLKGEVTELKAKLEVADAANRGLTDKVAASAAVASAQAEIVKASIDVMSVALDQPTGTAAALVGNELLAEHKRLTDSFTAKFPVGGVAAVHLPKAKAVVDDSTMPAALRLMRDRAAAAR